jgi:hypothetical protein
MRRPFTIIILTAVMALGGLRPGLAESLPVFVPMSGFSLLEPDYPPPPGGPRPYSQTTGALQWSVGPWGSPGGKLPPLRGTDNRFVSTAAAVAVSVTQAAGGSVLHLSQDGAPLACLKNGSPQEFDLFAEPNGASVKPPRLNGYTPGVQGRSLDTLAQLRLSAEVSISSGLAATRKHCQANFGNTQFAVILVNKSVRPSQILFYQLLFSHICGEAADIKLNACNLRRDKMEYYGRHNPYGVNDFLPLLGQEWLGNNTQATINADLLPRLLEAVTQGPPGMDHEPSHWTLGSVYLGQSIYGDTKLSSRWQNVSLTAVTR